MTRSPDRSPDAIADRHQQIIALSRAGTPVREICERVGVCNFTVISVRREAGVSKPRAPRMTADEIAQAEALLDDGCSIAEVARTLGRSRSHLGRLFPGRGWTMQQRDEHTRVIKTYEKGAWAIQIDSGWREKKWAVEEWKRTHPDQYAAEVEQAWNERLDAAPDGGEQHG